MVQDEGKGEMNVNIYSLNIIPKKNKASFLLKNYPYYFMKLEMLASKGSINYTM